MQAQGSGRKAGERFSTGKIISLAVEPEAICEDEVAMERPHACRARAPTCSLRAASV